MLFLLIEMIFDWEGFKKSFKEGVNDARKLLNKLLSLFDIVAGLLEYY